MKGKLGRKRKRLCLEKVRLYVQSMTNDDLEVKRVEPKSNQSVPPAAAMKTALDEKGSRLLNRKGSDTITMFA